VTIVVLDVFISICHVIIFLLVQYLMVPQHRLSMCGRRALSVAGLMTWPARSAV